MSVSQAQLSSPAPLDSPVVVAPETVVAPVASAKAANAAALSSATSDSNMMLVQAATPPAPSATRPVTAAPAAVSADSSAEASADSGNAGVREFQGDDVGQVLRLLARQSKINMVVSDQIPPNTTVTMRLEDVTALQAIAIIVKAKGLFMDKIDNVYYIKTAAERTAEPTESDSYQFSYSRAKDTAPLVAAQLQSKDAPQVDERTNTMFYRETRSNIDVIRKLLVQIDKPTKQVMIEARLVEVTANPRQSYGINWAGVVGSAAGGKTFGYGQTNAASSSPTSTNIPTTDFALGGKTNNAFSHIGNSLSQIATGQFAILTVPQMSVTMRALNEDADAEFLANPAHRHRRQSAG